MRKKEGIKMNKLRNKIAAIMIATLFMLSIAASTSIVSTTKAHSPPWQIADHAYIAVAPNPIGVGQTLSILIWTAQPLANSVITDNIRKENYVLTITAPDGTNTTQTFAVVSNTGGRTIHYVCTPTGRQLHGNIRLPRNDIPNPIPGNFYCSTYSSN